MLACLTLILLQVIAGSQPLSQLCGHATNENFPDCLVEQQMYGG